VEALEADLAKAPAANDGTDELRNQLQAAKKAAADEKESLQNAHQAAIEEANKSSAAEIKRIKDELAPAQNSNASAKGTDIESADHDDTFVSKYFGWGLGKNFDWKKRLGLTAVTGACGWFLGGWWSSSKKETVPSL